MDIHPEIAIVNNQLEITSDIEPIQEPPSNISQTVRPKRKRTEIKETSQTSLTICNRLSSGKFSSYTL